MENTFNGKILLITGGTGSFGTAMLQEMLRTNIKQIRILSRDQTKQHSMKQKYHDNRISYYIGDVRDIQSISSAFQGVDYVFHAAAMKQVPSCQQFPLQAIKTNILGSINVLQCAIKNDIQKIILLSTDKSVQPINTMGMTKALLQKLGIHYSRKSKTKICITRYGNVMATRGSVIPIFIQQAKNNIPITITDPNMTRYLMSLQQAIKLVLLALQIGDTGQIFVQKSPASTVIDLAQSIIDIFQSKSQVIVVGVRAGEKTHETLISQSEIKHVREFKQYYIIDKSNQYSGLTSAYTSETTHRLTTSELKGALLKLGIL